MFAFFAGKSGQVGDLPYLMLQAVGGPGDGRQPGRGDGTSADDALAVGAVGDPFQRVLHLLERLRFQSYFFQGFGGTLLRGGVVGCVPYFRLTCLAGFVFQASDIGKQFALFLAQYVGGIGHTSILLRLRVFTRQPSLPLIFSRSALPLAT